MKRYIILLALAALAFPGQSLGGKSVKDRETEYLSTVRFDSPVLSKDGRTVSLSMDIILDSTRINTQHTVRLTPVYVSKDGSKEKEFEPVIVDGRTRSKVFLREERFEGMSKDRKEAQAIIARKNRKPQEYSYMATIPYERWMLDGAVEVREEVHGCADCREGGSDRPLLGGIPEFIPSYAIDTIAPEPEPVKKREESRSAMLEFRHDRWDILPDWKNNKAELDTVFNSIRLLQDKDYLQITGIYIAGYASPEGEYEYNMRLSRRRAEAFADYIVMKEKLAPGLVHVEWGGEDWEKFRYHLSRTSLPYKDRLIEIIDTYTQDRNECERQMMKILTRDQYRWLLRNIYPALRYCLYRIEYEVENFDLEEARKMIYIDPDSLSLQEIYQVALSYAPGSGEYADAIYAAETCYPTRPAVLNRRASAAIAGGDAAGAVEILEGNVPADNAPLLNTFGVACALAGRYGEALEALQTAARLGNEKAAGNLAQLEGVLDQL